MGLAGDKRMVWILLVVAGLLEVGWAIGLKYTQGVSRLRLSVFTLTATATTVATVDEGSLP